VDEAAIERRGVLRGDALVIHDANILTAVPSSH
jgi:hypothetical protein